MFNNVKLSSRNIFGWSTNRKIVVLESDDWGSVRIKSAADARQMRDAGLPLSLSQFDSFDCLESNTDLESLFEVLLSHKDSTGRYAVITPLCVVANPNFDEIRRNNFTKYFYEPVTETCTHYIQHNRIIDLWRQGAQERLFVPQFHGREHINPLRWLRILSSGNKSLLCMFDHYSYGISEGFDKERIKPYLAAFDAEQKEDFNFIFDSVREGLSLFKDILGYKAEYFVPCSGIGIYEIEKLLSELGITTILCSRFNNIPSGDGKYKKAYRWLGENNKFGQTYLMRNCFFEPSDKTICLDWVDYTLREIKNAFHFHKPAIISTHRVNYIGTINKDNGDNGLNNLDRLLTNILNIWPDVEFMTSIELSNLIKG